MIDDAIDKLRKATRDSDHDEIVVRRDDLEVVLDAIRAARICGSVMPADERRAMLDETSVHLDASKYKDSGWHVARQCLLAMEDMARAYWPRGGAPRSSAGGETVAERLLLLCGQGTKKTVSVSRKDLSALAAEACESAERGFDSWCQIGPANMARRIWKAEADRLRSELDALRKGSSAGSER